jgi:hypothetical protein
MVEAMKDKLITLMYVFVTPFVVSASIEFMPGWLSWPISVLGGMVWIGSLFLMQEKKND